MNIAGIAVGFFAGILASVVASWVVSALPRHAHTRIIAFIRNPGLQIDLWCNTNVSEAIAPVKGLFGAWETFDEEGYRRCWNEDAQRYQGAINHEGRDLDGIMGCFARAIATYEKPHRVTLTFNSVEVFEEYAIVDISYQIIFARKIDRLPVVEESRDLYYLKRVDGSWGIHSNIEHYQSIGVAGQEKA